MARRRLSDDAILLQLPAAKARSAAALASRVRASNASVDRTERLLTVALTNGASFSVPVRKVPGLERASVEDASAVAVDTLGMGLHWDALDVDLSVAGLARLFLGESNVLAAAGAAGGKATSAAKAEAARRNGRKGGRPAKVTTTAARTTQHVRPRAFKKKKAR